MPGNHVQIDKNKKRNDKKSHVVLMGTEASGDEEEGEEKSKKRQAQVAYDIPARLPDTKTEFKKFPDESGDDEGGEHQLGRNGKD